MVSQLSAAELEKLREVFEASTDEELEIVSSAMAENMNVVEVSTRFKLNLVLASKFFNLSKKKSTVASIPVGISTDRIRSHSGQVPFHRLKVIPLRKSETECMWKYGGESFTGLSKNLANYLVCDKRSKSKERKLFLAITKFQLLRFKFPVGVHNMKDVRKSKESEKSRCEAIAGVLDWLQVECFYLLIWLSLLLDHN